MSITLSEVKTQLGITGTAEDTKLLQLIPQAISIAENYTRQSFCNSTKTELYNGNGSNKLFLNRTPINSITSVHVSNDRVFDSTTLLTVDKHYRFDSDSGIVYRINDYWPALRVRDSGQISGSGGYESYYDRSLVAVKTAGIQNIQVVYDGGYKVLPADVQFAMISLVALIRGQKAHGMPITSKSIDYWSVSYATDAESRERVDSVKSVLVRYRKPLI